MQVCLYVFGYAPIISLQDGITGLSAAKTPDAQLWFFKNYDGGFVLLDDYARTLSLIRSNISM